MSESETVNVGIPQGSCLGPLLFLVYKNDIFSSTEINMRLFADDACLSYQHSDSEYLTKVNKKNWVRLTNGCMLINFLLIVQKQNFCFSIKLQKIVNLVLKLMVFLLSRVIVYSIWVWFWMLS